MARRSLRRVEIAARVARHFQVSADDLPFDDREKEERGRDRETLDYLVKRAFSTREAFQSPLFTNQASN